MEHIKKSINLSNSRTLTYYEYGDSRGKPYIHGAGAGSALFASNLDKPAKELGIQVIAPNRSGIGGSTFLADHTLLSWADDLGE